MSSAEVRIAKVIAAARDAGVLPVHIAPALAARLTVALAFGVRGQLAGPASARTAAALREFLLSGLDAT